MCHILLYIPCAVEYYFILGDTAFPQCFNMSYIYTTAFSREWLFVCLPAFSSLCYTCTHWNAPLADRRQPLFVSDWDCAFHQQQCKANVKARWISVIKHVTVGMPLVTQVENWKCFGIPPFPLWSRWGRWRHLKIPNWQFRTLWQNLFHFQ